MKDISINRAAADLPTGFQDSQTVFVDCKHPQPDVIEADIMQTARHRTRYLQISPGLELEPMCHIYAAKRLVVLDGCARVTLNDKETMVLEGATLRIPAGVEHCIQNAGKITLSLLELRSGSYLGDDDQLISYQAVC